MSLFLFTPRDFLPTFFLPVVVGVGVGVEVAEEGGVSVSDGSSFGYFLGLPRGRFGGISCFI